MKNEFIHAYILDAPLHADLPYTYYLPEEMRDRVSPGTFVTVPFGAANRHRVAIAVSFTDESASDHTKPVLAVLTDRFSLCEELLGLCFFMKETTLCTYGDAVKAVVPSASLSRHTDYYLPDETLSERKENAIPIKLGDPAFFVYSYIKRKERVSITTLRAEFGVDLADSLSALLKEKAIRKETEIRAVENESYKSYVLPAKEKAALRAVLEDSPEAECKLRSVLQKALLRAVLNDGKRTDKELFEKTGGTRVQLDALVKKGLLRIEREKLFRDPYKNFKTDVRDAPVVLSDEQQKAYKAIRGLYLTHEPKGVLLHGVTGSGKTSVIKAMIDTVISDGRSVIILVPEIALTPQTVSIFCDYYGDRVAVLHSALSAGEKADAWSKIRGGEVDVVIGTRSAVFAPLPNLGMIVIDEEQEHTYKSDTSPKYDARDVARYRCSRHNALMLLASATPSFGSYYKARSGAYTLVELTRRYGNAKLPTVMPVDMRAEIKAGNTTAFSAALIEALKENLAAGKQSILFLNRRGYHNYVTCRECGDVIECPNCSVSLTYHRHGLSQHRAGQTDATGTLVCHYCGYRIPVPSKCPSCGSEHLSYEGCGTQKAEAELAALLPSARIMRMDADSTKGKESYQVLLGAFRKGEADILLGTQMVTKGHDFPNVTLVGVILADSSLYAGDYRAAERTFSLITQVIGRAGRGDAPGRAIIQTMNPENETLLAAAAQNYVKFYQKEIELRRSFLFPPFCDLVEIALSGTDEALVNSAAVRLSSYVTELIGREYADLPLVLYGPFDAPVYKVQNRFRKRVLLKCKLNRRSRGMLTKILSEFGKSAGRRIAVTADLNPSNI